MLLWPADWMESASDCWRLHWKFNIVELWKLQSATADDSHPPALATVASWSINTRTTVGVCRRAGRLLATEVFTQALRSCAVTISQNGGRRTRWIYIIADCVNTVPRSPSILRLERVMGPSDLGLHVAVNKHSYESRWGIKTPNCWANAQFMRKGTSNWQHFDRSGARSNQLSLFGAE